MGGHYRLACLHCGETFEEPEESFLLGCRSEHPPALLRAVYREKSFKVDASSPGIFRYSEWLPTRRILHSAGAPVVYRSLALSKRLGLDRLFISFSGYWPERGAFLESCSFKELEALAVYARLPDGMRKSLVVCSAGNTGRAFLNIGSLHGIPTLVVVPQAALADMWMTRGKHPSVRLAVLEAPADYLDAIELGDAICGLDRFSPEGGARNVARRDGLGTVLLAACEEIGEIPMHYFQAVGSGTGGIAAWEMSMRLREDGRFEGRKTRLHLVQNEPFAIMTDAWRKGSRQLEAMPESDARERIGRLHSRVLSNRKPPYAIRGGLYDALKDTGGSMYAVTAEEARRAGELFETLEGCDLDPAAEVALAGLIQAVESGLRGSGESVLLNVTGGGQRKLQGEGRIRGTKPDLFFTMEDARRKRVAAALGGGRE